VADIQPRGSLDYLHIIEATNQDVEGHRVAERIGPVLQGADAGDPDLGAYRNSFHCRQQRNRKVGMAIDGGEQAPIRLEHILVLDRTSNRYEHLPSHRNQVKRIPA
jgi:hypothetical protein